MVREMADGLWQKAIPPARDRKQSQGLVAAIGAVLILASAGTVLLSLSTAARHPAYVLSLLGISVGFAVIVWLLRAATPAAAAYGGMICLLITCWTGTFAASVLHTGLMPLAMLFVITFLATRAGRRRKAKAGLAESRKGRSAAQVIANLSAAALCATPLAYLLARGLSGHSLFNPVNLEDEWIRGMLKVMCLAALVEATADTVSSEIGQAYGGAPRMLLTLQKVKAGTDGAITTLGTLAGVIAGFVVAEGGAWGMHIFGQRALIAAVAGSLGLFFDSLLGATVERRGWLGNDLVNFSSTVFAALVAGVGYRLWIK
jgi:uncharacterized protein (TIGR00297 family)